MGCTDVDTIVSGLRQNTAEFWPEVEGQNLEATVTICTRDRNAGVYCIRWIPYSTLGLRVPDTQIK
jgi:hypothetical protein